MMVRLQSFQMGQDLSEFGVHGLFHASRSLDDGYQVKEKAAHLMKNTLVPAQAFQALRQLPHGGLPTVPEDVFLFLKKEGQGILWGFHSFYSDIKEIWGERGRASKRKLYLSNILL